PNALTLLSDMTECGMTASMAGPPRMFSDGDPCPCMSGLIVAACTCKPRRFVLQAANTQTPGPPTGRSLPRCYAAPLRDCAPPISGEHPVSRGAVLELIGGNSVRVFGERFHATGPEGKVIGLPSD